jgi:hypothetical protein
MANMTPFFLTGANAKIKVNHVTIAFATSVNYQVIVRHAKPRVLGKYEIEVAQPLAYDVMGSLSIIKYGRGIKDYLGTGPKDTTGLGNGVGSLSPAIDDIASAVNIPNAKGQFDGGAHHSFNPGKFFQSTMFDIEIQQKIQDPNNPEVNAPIIRLRECRFEQMSFDLNKRGAAIMTLSFCARFADDDTFIAVKSGVGQELS